MNLFDYMTEQNTLGADVNEILFAYYIAGENWKKVDGAANVQKQLKMRRKQLDDAEYVDQEERAKVSAQETLKWCTKNGYNHKIVRVWWTARPGVLSKAVGQEVDSKKNPTDVLLKFQDGKYLGISAKSTRGKRDIGFKNPGIGTLDKLVGVDSSDIIEKQTKLFYKQFPDAPATKRELKKWVRANPDIQVISREYGNKILTLIRDRYYEEMRKRMVKK